ncbi:alpha/beta hydrolase [Luminiphilus sp.]|nr:alpha/beta hydrolase [Luminiphilus sp.]
MTRKTMYTLHSRSVPGPGGASQEVQKAISETPVPDVAKWQKIAPESPAQWAELIAQMDEAEKSFIADYLSKAKVAVEPDKIGGVPVYHVSPAKVEVRLESQLFVLVHGGGYVSGAGEAGLAEAMLIASQAGVRVLAIDYRMPPAHPFPAGLDDVVEVYGHLLGKRPAKSIVLGGSSAGGGLALASVHRFKEDGLELPGAVFAGTPWSDLTKTGDSYYVNEGLDRALVSYEGVLAAAAELYAGKNDLTNALISPIYGEFEGFPPVLLISGSRDLFLSCTIRAHAKLRLAAVIADLLVFEGISHGDYAFLLDSPESRLYYKELKSFMLQHLI